MTKYKYQTNPSLVSVGELADVGGQLVSNNGSGNVVVGNPANSTALATLAQTYAADTIDLSIAKTLGTNFVFLNGTSFDSIGVGVFEFEESNGVVYGLYGRTDGLSQQVYFSGAWSNKQPLQYTTVPYVPPFLNGSVWQAACVVGSDLQGFTLALRDTSGATLTLRYIYVRHGGSLINTAGHTYVEITPVVQNYLNSVTHVAGAIPRVVRVGAYFFISMGDWQYGSLWFGGWNAQDSTYPFSSAAFPASSPSYTPQTFTIVTNGLPGGDVTTATQFPVLVGNAAPSGNSNFRIYNLANGQTTSPIFMNAPLPTASGWATNLSAMLEGEVDGAGNPFLAIGALIAPGDANNLAPIHQLVFSVAVQFTAGSAGAYTAATLNFANSNTPGTDLYHMQPAGSPIYISANGSVQPNETVQSNASTPSTFYNKLPVASWTMGQGTVWQQYSLSLQWYYSGTVAVTVFGTGNIIRGVTQPVGNTAGSLAAAQANKLASLYPMFNVNRRVDFNGNTGVGMTGRFVQPSGQLIQNWFGRVMSQDLLFSQGVNNLGQAIQTISKLPSGSSITDASYNRFGQTVPGMRGRVAEYLVNTLPYLGNTLSTWGSVWPVGMASVNSPINFQFPVITDSGPFANLVSGNSVRVGNFTQNGSTYNPPPVVWTYSASMVSQMNAIKTAALAAAHAAHSDFGGGGSYGIELVPVMNSAGNGIAFALGLIQARDTGGNVLQVYTFTTPCSVSGNVVSFTNTSSITEVAYITTTTLGVNGQYWANDSIPGSLYVVYPAAAGGDFYIAWQNANSCGTAGDSLATMSFYRFNSSNVVQQSAGVSRSQSRAMVSCSAQHQGLAVVPYRNGVTVPEADIPLARYATSAVNTQNDFAAGFNAAFSNPMNTIPASFPDSYNLAELLVLSSINNQFLLQLGAISGRINHKEFVLPSTFLDLTSAAVGTYYLYVTDTGAGGVQIQYDSVQRAESATNMYFGTFARTSTGFSSQKSIQEVIRFGTARLQTGNIISPINGSCIRTGTYPMSTT